MKNRVQGAIVGFVIGLIIAIFFIPDVVSSAGQQSTFVCQDLHLPICQKGYQDCRNIIDSLKFDPDIRLFQERFTCHPRY